MTPSYRSHTPALFRALLLPLSLALLLTWSLAPPALAQVGISHIQLGKTNYQNGESMVIRAMVRAPKNAVIAILPASATDPDWTVVQDQALVQFPAAEDVPLTVQMVPAPLAGGEYEVRLFENGKLSASVAFHVEQTNGISLEQTNFNLGQAVPVAFKAGTISVPNERDWTLAIVPKGEPYNALSEVTVMDSAKLGGEASGRIELSAPLHPGQYEVRMYNGVGREMAVAAISVTQESRLALAEQTVVMGQEFRVAFQADHLPDDAWIGIVPAGVDLGDPEENLEQAVARQPLKGMTGGTMTFKAPRKEGEWELRMFSSKTGRPLDTAPFETIWVEGLVLAEEEPEPVIEPVAEPEPEVAEVAQAEPEPETVAAEPAAGAMATEPVYEPDIPAPMPETMSAPQPEPVMASESAAPAPAPTPVPTTTPAPVMAAAPMADTLRLDKKLAQPGETLTVDFTASSTPGDTAWIGIVPATAPRKGAQTGRNGSLSSESVAGRSKGSVALTVPEELGSYEVRFFAANNGPELASVAFEATIRTTSIHLEKNKYAPRETVDVFYSIEDVTPMAWIGIVSSTLVSKEPDKNSDRAQQKRSLEGRIGGNLTFTAPAEPGLYELRMFSNETDGELLFKKMFLVR